MIFNTTINLGARQAPATDNVFRQFTYGISMAGDVLVYDRQTHYTDIPLFFKRVSSANKQALIDYLTPRCWQQIDVTLDSGDDLGVGLSGANSDMYYVGNSLQSNWLYGDWWSVSFVLRYFNEDLS